MLVSLLILGLTAGGFVAARAQTEEVPPQLGAGEVSDSEAPLPTPIPLPSGTPLPTPLPSVDRATIVDTAVTYWGVFVPFDVPPGLEEVAVALGVSEPRASTDDVEAVGTPSPSAAPEAAPPPADEGSVADDGAAESTPAPLAVPLPTLEPVEPVETPIPLPAPLPTVDLSLETPTPLPLP